MVRVVIENLTKIFKGPKGESIQAVDKAALDVEDGEFLVLVGPSGCGKSTILRMIAGLEDVTSGTISIDGKMMNQVPPKDRNVAMVFQNYALYPHLTVYENLALGLKLRRHPKAETELHVREVAIALGLADCLDRHPAALSGGQRQRVALGRAIVLQPKVFLFDEPLSNLDAKMRVQMRREISKLHARLGATMIYVTHDQVEAMTLGDRIVVMKRGVIQQVGDPMTLYRQPANMFVAGFIGSPPMNFFTGSILQTDGGIAFHEKVAPGTGRPGFMLPLEKDHAARLANHVGGEIILGVRPENILTVLPDTPASSVISATLELIEPTGAETYLYLATGAHSFAIRTGTGFPGTVGQEMTLAFDKHHVHFFDPATERVIG